MFDIIDARCNHEVRDGDVCPLEQTISETAERISFYCMGTKDFSGSLLLFALKLLTENERGLRSSAVLRIVGW